jgi:hypothetical protein
MRVREKGGGADAILRWHSTNAQKKLLKASETTRRIDEDDGNRFSFKRDFEKIK